MGYIHLTLYRSNSLQLPILIRSGCCLLIDRRRHMPSPVKISLIQTGIANAREDAVATELTTELLYASQWGESTLIKDW